MSATTIVPAVRPSLSLVKSNPVSVPVRMTPVERFAFESAITRAFLTGLTHQRKQRAGVSQ